VRRASFFVKIEQAAKEAIRNGPGLRARASPWLALPAAAVCAYFIPQLLTGTSSYQDARAACRDNSIALEIGRTSENFKDAVDLESAKKDKKLAKNALRDLHPSRVFSLVPTVVSLVCFIAWVFFTPHRPMASLDQKRTPMTQPCPLLLLQDDAPPISKESDL
jgi:hypothetical protein